jgi:peptidoglycan/xylan/chitin deacetylase (PgdA/CDA1 family)
MARMNKTIIRGGLEALYYSGGHRLARRFLGGLGAILTFHHVRPASSGEFQPNRALQVSPQFLDEVIRRLRAADIEIVPLDEARRRILEPETAQRFVSLTFDDAYRDNREHAWPILRRHGAPFTVFVASRFADGSGDLWWVALERAIAGSTNFAVQMNGQLRRFDCASETAKDEAFQTVYWWLRGLPDEIEMRALVHGLCDAAGVDADGICRELCLGWDELRELADEPLATIGSHTHDHFMLAKAPRADIARAEIESGIGRIHAKLGLRPRHLAYPVGDPTSAGPREFAIAAELGLATAVTTRPGVIFADHRDHLTALPRISMNGDFQRLRYLDVLLSGAPTALMNRFRRVNAA